MKPIQMSGYSHSQRGAALVVSLVMMVVLTLIGVTAMNSSSIELIMASNTQLETRAMANAERTLATAETVTQGLVKQTTYTEPGIYNIANEAGGNLLSLQLASTWSTGSDQGDTEDDRYIIEYIGEFSGDGESQGTQNNNPLALGKVELYRVTARSEDAKGAVRMVQSIYVKAAN